MKGIPFSLLSALVLFGTALMRTSMADSEGSTLFIIDGPRCDAAARRFPVRSCKSGGFVVYSAEETIFDDQNRQLLDELPYIAGDIKDSRVYTIENFNIYDYGNSPEFISKTDLGRNFALDLGNNLISVNGTHEATAYYRHLDVHNCLSQSTAGTPIVLAPQYHANVYTPVYFLQECGKTVHLPDVLGDGLTVPHVMSIFSHRGYGCVDYPIGTLVDCTVTFKSSSYGDLNLYKGPEDTLRWHHYHKLEFQLWQSSGDGSL